MTTDHPDDELLSALLDARRFAVDGQPADDVTDHIAGCDICQHRLARLAEVVAAVAAPVTPPSEEVREAAISRALATDAARGEAAVGEGQVARIDRRLAMPRGRQLARVLGAAAIVLALLGALPVLLSKSSSSKSTSAASRVTGTVASATATTTAGASGTNSYATPATAPGQRDSVAGADLGSQSDPVQLAQQVGQALATAKVTSPQANSATQNSSLGVARAGLPCEAAAASSAGAGGLAGSATPIFAASLTWKGTPADVYAFTTAAGRQAVVVSRTDCQILQVLPL